MIIPVFALNELEAHYQRHAGWPRCAGEGEIPNTTTTDGRTRVCPGPLAALEER